MNITNEALIDRYVSINLTLCYNLYRRLLLEIRWKYSCMLTEEQKPQPKKHVPWIRIIVAIFFSLLFTGAAIIGILHNLNSLFNILSIAFAILGALLALFQWLFPFSAMNTNGSPSTNAPLLLPSISRDVPASQSPQKNESNLQVSHMNTDQQVICWTVPYRRNPFFTGRETLLYYLHEQLNKNKTTALTQAQAINGLGGIGKTQTAVEYAYRYQHEYRFVFWIRAATRNTLIADFMTIAEMLQLPEKNEPDQTIAVAAVRRWLAKNQNWLLILDNADDLTVIHDYLPTGNNGHILITTRAQAIGLIAHSITVDKMNTEEGILFLLRRAKILSPESSLDKAEKGTQIQAAAIFEAMDGLPLALDQAGAYIEETSCGLSRYLDLHNTHQRKLLQRRGQYPIDHPESVATTWSLSFQKIEQGNPASADLLRLCAFLDPDAIPEEILIEGSPDLSPGLTPLAVDLYKLDTAIEEVLRYSLMRRNIETKTLSMHRLVQAVLRDRMSQTTQRLWMECAVRVINRMFPDVTLITWPRCQRYLPHAQACITFINDCQLMLPEAAQLLTKVGYYLQEAHAQYGQAESLFQHALMIREQMLGSEHPETATSLDFLGQLYKDQARYKDAESLFQRALTIREQTLGSNHLETATSLESLGKLYQYQGKYKEAELPLQRALTIREQMLGSEHPETATSLQYLGRLYRDQGRYQEAEALFQRASAIDKQALGPDHPSVAISLEYLGQLYLIRGKYKEAEPLFQRALTIRERTLGPDHLETATSLESLGWLYRHQGKYKEAELLSQRALKVYERVLKLEHLSTADGLDGLGWLYRDQGKFKEAESLYQKALAIKQKLLEPNHPSMASSFANLGLLYLMQGRYKEAEPMLIRALAIDVQLLGSNHPFTAVILQYLGLLYLMQSRYNEAEPMLMQALKINEQSLGAISHRVGILLEEYAFLHLRTGQLIKAGKFGIQGLRVLGLRETMRYAVIAVRVYQQKTHKISQSFEKSK